MDCAYLPIFTARIPWEWGRHCFHRCLFIFRRKRVPHLHSIILSSTGPMSFLGGISQYLVPCPFPPLVRRQSSIASSCYAAGGMPLGFTQEDFLVLICISSVTSKSLLCSIVNPNCLFPFLR